MRLRSEDLPRKRRQQMRVFTIITSVTLLLFSLKAHSITLSDVVLAERDGGCSTLVSTSPPLNAIEWELANAYLARCLMNEGTFSAAISALDRMSLSLNQTGHELSDLTWLSELQARALLHQGEALQAVAAYRSLVREGDSAGAGAVDQGSRARLLYYLGLSYEASGDVREAVLTYRRLAHEYPASAYVSRVNVMLLDDELSEAQQMDLADAARRGRHYDLAERLYTQVACPDQIGTRWIMNEGFDGGSCAPPVVLSANDPMRYEAAYQLGRLLYRYRREHYERGLPWLLEVAASTGPRQGDAIYGLGKAFTRAERYEEALRYWEQLQERFPAHFGGHEAVWMLGEIPLIMDDYESAIPQQQRYLETFSAGRYRSQTQWHLGWSYYRLENYEAAISAWEPLMRRRTWRSQVRYWSAICAFALDDQDSANVNLHTLIEEEPFSYYGVLASQRLGETVFAELTPTTTENWTEELSSSAQLVLEIAALGLIDEARLLERFDSRVVRPSGLSGERWEMIVEADRSDWSRWRRRYRNNLNEFPHNEASRLAWEFSLPSFYQTIVQEAAESAEIPPSLIWAIMRRESSYNRNALSRSDAMGLMQVIPQTASKISIELGERYTDGMLFQPNHAVRYGSWYLGELTNMFGGQLGLAAGAYNAGPIAMIRWVERNGGMRFDHFVEEIPYEQARTYIKRVLTTVIRYEIAWEKDELLRNEHYLALFPERATEEYQEGVRF